VDGDMRVRRNVQPAVADLRRGEHGFCDVHPPAWNRWCTRHGTSTERDSADARGTNACLAASVRPCGRCGWLDPSSCVREAAATLCVRHGHCSAPTASSSARRRRAQPSDRKRLPLIEYKKMPLSLSLAAMISPSSSLDHLSTSKLQPSGWTIERTNLSRPNVLAARPPVLTRSAHLQILCAYHHSGLALDFARRASASLRPGA
jgi:hypothetical protein